MEYLSRRFQFFNQKYFSNRLTPISFFFSDQRDYLERDYGAKFIAKNLPENCIDIQKESAYVFARWVMARKDFADVILLHEMCHHACYEIDKKVDNHDSLWKGYMNNIGLTPPERYQLSIDITKIPNYKCYTLNELFNYINIAIGREDLVLDYSNIEEVIGGERRKPRDNSIKLKQCNPPSQKKIDAITKFYHMLSPVFDELCAEYNKMSKKKVRKNTYISELLNSIGEHNYGFSILKMSSKVGGSFSEIRKYIQDNPEFDKIVQQEKNGWF